MYLLYGGVFEKIRNSYFNKILTKYTISKGKTLLDYGCGPGDMMLLGKMRKIRVFGIDNDKRSVMLAKKRGLDVLLGDAKNMKYKKNFFDVIFLQSVLEHDRDPVGLVMKLKQFLKKDGLLILSSPTPGYHFWDDPTHVRPFTPRSFKIIGDICELEILEINYVFSFILGLNFTNAIFYLLMNLVPLAMGSNIIGVYKKF